MQVPGAPTVSTLPNSASEAVLNVQVNSQDGVGNFGYMDIVDKNYRAPSACQVLASNSYGKVVVPSSNLWTL
uniref:Uncharacterized protein n=1 Tax=Parascaris equorum TaxID=6256 RepID=A0A914S3I8_PAREQ